MCMWRGVAPTGQKYSSIIFYQYLAPNGAV
jgi:hypothetical protein